jgi:23S rRNA U2552 (ribose-2'-O)-methylase RlmE/FtsJ
MYKPQLYSINTSNIDINFLDETNSDTVHISTNITQPSIDMGFHSFLHRTKNSMSITKDLETKNKFYYIVNPFEDNIENYDKSISKIATNFFNITKDPEILSRAFYKLWEILLVFNIANNSKLTCATLAEGPGGFVQAIIQYRKKYKFNINDDKIFSITIHPEKGNNILMNKKFMGYYKQTNPNLICQFKTCTKNTSKKYTGKSNGDLTEIKTINLFQKEIASKSIGIDLVTADGGFLWTDENYQEQEAYKLILGEIITALKVLNKDGSFVLKIFETFTVTTNKMLYILGSFFKEMYIYKPYFSRNSNSEKYIVCKGFKYAFKNKEVSSKVGILEKVLNKMDSNLFVNDIFTDLILPQDFLNKIKFININIANNQQIMINKIITYIKGNNYFGEAYHEYKDQSIEASKWWSNVFFNDSNKNTFMQDNAEYYEKEFENFSKKLI